jgi:hypothetical protein
MQTMQQAILNLGRNTGVSNTSRTLSCTTTNDVYEQNIKVPLELQVLQTTEILKSKTELNSPNNLSPNVTWKKAELNRSLDEL